MISPLHLPLGSHHPHLQEIVPAVELLTADIAHVNETAGTMTGLVDALAIHETNLTNRDMIEGTGIMADGMTGVAHLVTMTVMVADATGEVPLLRLHLRLHLRFPSSMSLLVMIIFTALTYVNQTTISYVRGPSRRAL
jgi:hypothetical protein